MCEVSIPGKAGGSIPPKPGLAPQRDLIASSQNQNREPFIVHSIARVFILVIPAKAGIRSFRMVPGLRRDDVWIPGRVSLARNDDSTFPELSDSGFREAEASPTPDSHGAGFRSIFVNAS
jgi:hypothetical protein